MSQPETPRFGHMYAVRADYAKQEYYVVESASGAVLATYPYEGSELSRGEAGGRAAGHRQDLITAAVKAFISEHAA